MNFAQVLTSESVPRGGVTASMHRREESADVVRAAAARRAPPTPAGIRHRLSRSGRPVRADTLVPLLDGVRREHHRAHHLELELSAKVRIAGLLGEALTRDLDGVVEVAGQPDGSAPRQGDPQPLLGG